VKVTIRAITANATAVIVVRWKPSAGSRSLSWDIRALRTAHADSGPLSDSIRSAHREPTSPFQSARDLSVGVGYRSCHVVTACATSIPLAD